MSLRLKLFALISLPLLIVFTFCGLSLKESLKQVHAAQDSHKYGQFFKATSEVVHLVQQERGKSALFLNQKLSREELDSHRAEVDKLAAEFLKTSTQASFSGEDRQKVSGTLEELKNLRVDISNGIPSGQASQRYSDLIYKMILMQVQAGRLTTAEGIEAKLLALIALEVSKENMGRLRATVTGFLGADKPLSATDVVSIASFRAAIEANMNSPTLNVSEAGQNTLHKLKSGPDWLKVEDVYQAVVKNADRGNFGVNSKDFYTAITNSINEMSVVIVAENKTIMGEIVAFDESSTASMYLMAAMTVGIFLGMSLLTFFVVRAITRPIQKVATDLNDSATSVTDASEQLRKLSEQISSGTTESAASLEETVASLEEISSMVHRNAENAKAAAALSSQSRDSAVKGEAEIRLLTDAMSEVAGSSRKVAEIINVIDDIAFQTNLLALNAAVEAARAGEQGRGFAVVADAVRALAQRSAVAAKDIASLIRESAEKTELGVRKASESGEVLLEIVTSVKKVSDLVNEISGANQEQSTGLALISQAMTQLDASTQLNASSAEKTSGSARAMSDQAVQMKDCVLSLNKAIYGSEKTQMAVGAPVESPVKMIKNISIQKRAA